MRIEGDPENPATAGEVCLKGLSYVERVIHEDRITSPLRRNRKGDLEPVSWDDALDGIVAGLWAIRKESGPLAVLHYEGSGSHGALSGLAEGFLEPFRRSHPGPRRPLLACGAGGDAPHLRGQPPQPSQA